MTASINEITPSRNPVDRRARGLGLQRNFTWGHSDLRAGRNSWTS